MNTQNNFNLSNPYYRLLNQEEIDNRRKWNKSKRRFTTVTRDFDFERSEFIIDGRMTKRRYDILNKYAMDKARYPHCGCSHDCCGCLNSVNYELDYNGQDWVLSITQHYNY